MATYVIGFNDELQRGEDSVFLALMQLLGARKIFGSSWIFNHPKSRYGSIIRNFLASYIGFGNAMLVMEVTDLVANNAIYTES